jgi:predicted MPP superfamily phosphohydrolase
MTCLPLAAAAFGHILPAALTAPGFLWHLLVLPPVIAVMGVIDIVLWRRRRARPVPQSNLDRRHFLTAAMALTPPLMTGGLTAAALAQLGHFRTRDLDLPVAGWPPELSGFTIALVADVHTGPFTTSKMLEEIVRRTNTIHNGGPADLVLLGGDLINTSLRDLPAGLDMATALRGRLGTVACLGNHDVMDDGRKFVIEVEKRGIPLLRDDGLTLRASPTTRIQILGVRWQTGDQALYQSVAATAARWDRSLFPICMAHHPHCWDEAVRRGLPLVLSGHTHGGQIMLTDRIGAGPLRFRYWTGVHRRANSTLVISNGVGNWFPLRYNAPAEILKISLRPAPPPAESLPPPTATA